jgi:hypothetical protein
MELKFTIFRYIYKKKRKMTVFLSLLWTNAANASRPGRKGSDGGGGVKVVLMLLAWMIPQAIQFSLQHHYHLYAEAFAASSRLQNRASLRLFVITNNDEDAKDAVVTRTTHDATTKTTTTATTTAASLSTPYDVTSQNRRRPRGVTDFEEWFTKLDHPKASVHPAVQHDPFAISSSLSSSSSSSSYLRGLSWDSDYVIYSKNKIVTIPGDFVLSSKYTNNENWDRDLALELWNEMHKPNHTSSIWGYCSLLGQGNDWKTTSKDAIPPSTAPHALRHWTTQQKERLTKSPAGQALLELNQRQLEQWKKKYPIQQQQQQPTSSFCSESQFAWAMEAVHSRAFCGIPTNPLQDLPYLLAPILAAGIGYWYATTMVGSSSSFASTNPWEDPVLMTLALGTVALTALSFTKQDTKWAVLLPLIDSANHMDDADSVIDYDPLRKCFELTVGSSSFVEEPVFMVEENEEDHHHQSQKHPLPQKRQVYISYGKKGDAEWLLNYGLLPGIRSLDLDDDDDEYRRRLAEAFLERNSS